jgi:hypothetical protein
MKPLFIILFLLYLGPLEAQTIDRSYVIKWIKAIDSTYTPDSVIAYYIDGGLYYTYDTVKFNAALKQVNLKNLKDIYYSRVKMDNYVPGRGSIGILKISQLEKEEIKNWLKDAKKLFRDNYNSLQQNISYKDKDPILVIDKKTILPYQARGTLEKLDPNDIYDISVNRSKVPATIYGLNAKNGLVQIWTKKFVKG